MSPIISTITIIAYFLAVQIDKSSFPCPALVHTTGTSEFVLLLGTVSSEVKISTNIACIAISKAILIKPIGILLFTSKRVIIFIEESHLLPADYKCCPTYDCLGIS